MENAHEIKLADLGNELTLRRTIFEIGETGSFFNSNQNFRRRDRDRSGLKGSRENLRSTRSRLDRALRAEFHACHDFPALVDRHAEIVTNVRKRDAEAGKEKFRACLRRIAAGLFETAAGAPHFFDNFSHWMRGFRATFTEIRSMRLMTDRIIKWDKGEAEIQLLGGMLAPVRFILEDRRIVQPFAVAPWADDSSPRHAELPGLMKRLRGEWPCVPFGAPNTPEGIPEGWRPDEANPVDSEYHGYCSNYEWRVEDECEGAIAISISYPQDHPVRRLARRIEGLPGEATIKISLTIEARRAVALPIALHPVFRLPENPERARLDLGKYDVGRVFPLPVEPGKSRLVPDAEFETIRQVPARDGFARLDRFPLGFDTEEIVQVCGVSGHATLTNEDEDYRAHLRFCPKFFPSVLLWISNRGRAFYPWNGRFVALGIEPVRAAFDLGPAVGSYAGNPIAKSGYPTALTLLPGEPVTTSYEIGVESTAIG